MRYKNITIISIIILCFNYNTLVAEVVTNSMPDISNIVVRDISITDLNGKEFFNKLRNIVESTSGITLNIDATAKQIESVKSVCFGCKEMPLKLFMRCISAEIDWDIYMEKRSITLTPVAMEWFILVPFDDTLGDETKTSSGCFRFQVYGPVSDCKPSFYGSNITVNSAVTWLEKELKTKITTPRYNDNAIIYVRRNNTQLPVAVMLLSLIDFFNKSAKKEPFLLRTWLSSEKPHEQLSIVKEIPFKRRKACSFVFKKFKGENTEKGRIITESVNTLIKGNPSNYFCVLPTADICVVKIRRKYASKLFTVYVCKEPLGKFSVSP